MDKKAGSIKVVSDELMEENSKIRVMRVMKA